LALQQVETLCAELSQDDPEFEFIADDYAFQDDAMHAERAVLFYTDRDRLAYKRNLANKMAVVLGAAYVKTTYERKTKPKRGYNPEPDAVGADPFNGSIAAYDGPTNTVHSPLQIFPAPNATDLQLDCPYLFHEFGRTMQQLKAAMNPDGSPRYTNLDLLEKSGPAMREQLGLRTESPEAQKARRMGMYQVHEMWTPGGLVVLGNETVLLRVQDDNPYGRIPYTLLKVVEDIGELHGLSIVEIIEDMQEGIHTLHNRYIDAVNLAVNPPVEFDMDTNPSGASQAIYPGSRHGKDGGGESAFMPMQITLSNYNIEQAIQSLQQSMEQITGINSALSGFDDSNTATQAAINVRQGKGRIGAMMDVLDEGWSRVAQQMLDIVLDFVSG